MLRIDSISLNIGKRQILNNVSLNVKPGELLAVLGANGAGKSTLLKVIAGEINASSGSVSYSGKELKNFTSKGLAKIRGVLSQSFSLNMPYKVEEVVMMGRYPYFKEVPSSLDYEIVKAAMQQVDVLSFQDRVYTTLSGGEKQRVHIARVLAQIWNEEKTDNHTANYLLLDEPVSSLDILHQHRILQLGQELKEKGYAVLAVLHDMNLASQYTDRVAILKNGSLIACGITREVLNEVNIYKAFGMAVTVINQAGYSFPFIVPDVPLLEPLLSQTNKEISSQLINH